MKKFNESIVFKSIFGIVLMLAVFSLIVSSLGYKGFTEALLEQYADGAFRTADASTTLIDTDEMTSFILSGGKSERYKNTYARLSRMCNATGMTFIYVIQPDTTDYEHITFIFSTINENSGYDQYPFGYVRETTNEDYKNKYRRLYEGDSERELVIRDKGYIETDPHITAMMPLKNSAGEPVGILCVQRQMDSLLKSRNAYLKEVLIVMLIIALLVIFGQSSYLHKVCLMPIKKITDEAKRYATENVPSEKKLTEIISNKDEIGQLAHSIDQMEETIQEYVINLTKITAEKERISTELELATHIQADMLPSVFPAFPGRKELDIFASMNPAREVGGDFYDFFFIDDDHLYMAVADVSGKGVPAALFMIAAKIILANNAKNESSPAQIMESANQYMCENNKEEMFVTVWMGILEISTGKLKAANAGHEYPVIREPGKKFELLKDKHSFVMGAAETTKYHDYELQLTPGSKIFLYTDGVPEATDAHNNMFGTKRMLEALNKEPTASPKHIIENVNKEVGIFVKDEEQFDDLTMLCLEYKGIL
ncbi:MAG: SpoIIE family protein phosphatase [Lachnospiraceae bacterium]|nr:SpoIIE family protein phosphatase [Lachnospiraceae bacterium]